MAKTVLSLIAVLALCIASLAKDAAYYKAIQKASSSKVQPAQFKEMEEKALKDYSQAESYELLATSFGNTTEKVWALIYGEIYCSLSSDSDRISQVGSLVYRESLNRSCHPFDGTFPHHSRAISELPNPFRGAKVSLLRQALSVCRISRIAMIIGQFLRCSAGGSSRDAGPTRS